ncbi:hypothetical protein TNCV_339941 [Trichonephila clavipes]|nr:hypothetical protein TNCV_339941 [Trichonephila clavipes]
MHRELQNVSRLTCPRRSRPQFSLVEKVGPRLYPKGAGYASHATPIDTNYAMVYKGFLRAGANIRSSAELAERLSLPEKIPTPPAEPERIPTPPAKPERMPTSPAEPEIRPTPPAERPPLDKADPLF